VVDVEGCIGLKDSAVLLFVGLLFLLVNMMVGIQQQAFVPTEAPSSATHRTKGQPTKT
jgi:hypothetical protein